LAGKWFRAACAAAAVAALAAGCSSGGGSAAAGSNTMSAQSIGPAEKTTLNVGVVPAMDSAGFFVALHEGLFAKEGLTINYTPAVSSDTVIGSQLQGQLDITGGNYVSYIQAAAEKHDPFEVIAEGSVMQQGSQVIFTMPKSDIKTLAGLKGHVLGVNAPEHRLSARRVRALRERGQHGLRQVPRRSRSRSPTWPGNCRRARSTPPPCLSRSPASPSSSSAPSRSRT
jgi:NitT/TauT family transport system substrate-binding protein